MTLQTRASIFGIKEETIEGTLIPLVAADFLPLMNGGFSAEAGLETIENNELIAGDIARGKKITGKQSPKGQFKCYCKGSGVEGTPAKWTEFIKIAMGSQTDHATETTLTTGSSASVLNVATGTAVNTEVGHALLIKDLVNGYSIRNTESINTDAVTLNFKVGTAPLTGVKLGKASLFKGVGTGHKSFSSWLYHANSGAIEAIAGNRCSSLGFKFTAGQLAEVDINFEGTSFFRDPVVIVATNKYIDFIEGAGSELTATLTEKIYKTPYHLAAEIKAKMEDAGALTYTVTFDWQTGKYTIAAGSAFTLLWQSGTNTANSAGTILGFGVVADSTPGLTATAGTALSLVASVTPVYDTALVDPIIVKSNEIFIGTSVNDNVCLKASEVNVNVDATITEITSICSETGVYSKPITGRKVTLSATVLMEANQCNLFYAQFANQSIKAMFNTGAKDDAGNWIPGKCFNFYFGNASVTSSTIGGDEFRTISIAIEGYITSTLKDCYINTL